MAADGIEEETPRDKAGAWALVSWPLEVSVQFEAHTHPLLKGPRHSRTPTLAHALGSDKGTLEAMPCTQGTPWFQP